MLLNKCKHFDAIDYLKNNILHYACISVCLKSNYLFVYYLKYL